MSKRILLIDDERDIVQIMRKKVQAAGYEVSVAYNGEEGLEITEHEHPHLILTDVMMPVMDGLRFYRELKSRQDLSHIPVIVASAHGGTEDAFRVLGIKDFLNKPFETQVLLDKVNGFFHANRAVNVLMATKMLYLIKSILNESWNALENINLQLTRSQATVVEEAVSLKPQLIVLDVDMFFSPTADEVVRTLRSHPDLKETTILLTRSMLGDLAALAGSRQSDKAVEDCMARGASHFIGSLNKNSLMSVIKDYCR